MRREIVVDRDACDLCRRCVRYCPADLLRIENDMVVVKYPGECWVCGICELECEPDAIEVQFACLT